MKRLTLLLIILVALSSSSFGDNTHSTGNPQNELGFWFGDAMSPFLVSGCSPTVPSSSLVFGAFACAGYVEDSSGKMLYVTQPAVSLTLANTNGNHWLALSQDTSSVVASWTRRAGSHYLFRQTASQPADPTGGLVFAKVTVAGGVITAVQVVANTNPVKFPQGVNVRAFGAVGDCSTDDATAFTNAMAASTRVYVPTPTTCYKIASALTIPANTWLVGDNKYTTKIQKAFNGDLFTLGDGAGLLSLYLEGDGDTFSGKALVLAGTNGRQVVEHAKIINFQGAIFDIATAAGSQMSVIDINMIRWNIATHAQAATGSGLYAVVISPTQQLSAVPRKFLHVESNGGPTFDFGGSNGTFVSDAFLGDLLYNAESRGVHLANCRWANQAAATLDGHNNTITGCGIAPALTIASGSDDWWIMDNSLNLPPITDNSGVYNNFIQYPTVIYTPTWTATTGTAPAIGNGTLRGQYSRSGQQITLTIELIWGTTTTGGNAGAWNFSTPLGYSSHGTGTPQVQVGSGYALDDSSGTIAVVAPSLTVSTSVIVVNAVGGQLNFAQPWTWATSDILRFTITYDH